MNKIDEIKQKVKSSNSFKLLKFQYKNSKVDIVNGVEQISEEYVKWVQNLQNIVLEIIECTIQETAKEIFKLLECKMKENNVCLLEDETHVLIYRYMISKEEYEEIKKQFLGGEK